MMIVIVKTLCTTDTVHATKYIPGMFHNVYYRYDLIFQHFSIPNNAIQQMHVY